MAHNTVIVAINAPEEFAASMDPSAWGYFRRYAASDDVDVIAASMVLTPGKDWLSVTVSCTCGCWLQLGRYIGDRDPKWIVLHDHNTCGPDATLPTLSAVVKH